MKKFVCLLAGALLLLPMLWQPAHSLANPYGRSLVNRSEVEDHPWGGEQNNGTGGGLQTSTVPSGYTVTGISALDTYLLKLYVSWFGSGTTSTYGTISWNTSSGTTSGTTVKSTQPEVQTTTGTTTTTTTTTATGPSRNN